MHPVLSFFLGAMLGVGAAVLRNAVRSAPKDAVPSGLPPTKQMTILRDAAGFRVYAPVETLPNPALSQLVGLLQREEMRQRPQEAHN